MNILLSVHHFMDRNAGAPGVTLRLAEEYRRLGHEVDIFSYDQLPKGMPDMLVNLLYPQYLHAYCRRRAGQGRLDVIDASSGDIWFHLLMRSRRDQTVVVTRSHGLEHMAHQAMRQRVEQGELKLSWKYPLYHGGYRLWEVERSFRLADGVLLLNREEHGFAAQQWGLPPSEVIGNGVPDYLLDLPLQPAPGEGNPLRIALLGTYLPRKGIEYAAQSLPELMARYPVEVTFLGTLCPPEKVLADYDPSLHSRIRVIPRFEHDRLPELLGEHHILLFPSLSEGMPLSLLEAMACGLAPVATAIPGANDILTPMEDALLIPPRDAGAIVSALDRLLTDRALLERLRHAARSRAQQYGWGQVAARTLAFYGQCAARKAGPAGRTKLEAIG